MPTFTPMPPDEVLKLESAEYVSTSDAAKLVGVHRDTMRRWADKGLVPTLRTPTGHRRFLVTDLLAAMNQVA